MARGSAINPQSLNRYAYALDNPVNLVDPLGLSCVVVNYDDGTTAMGDDGDGKGCADANIAPNGTDMDLTPSAEVNDTAYDIPLV